MNKREKNEKLMQKNLDFENSVYLSQEIAKKNYFLRLNQRKVKCDGIQGKAMTESEYWREEKIFSQPCLPTTEATTGREVGVHTVRGRAGVVESSVEPECRRTILRWDLLSPLKSLATSLFFSQ